MNCVSCHKELSPESIFCNFCGAKQSLSCSSCGTTLSPNSLFCNLCGTKLGGKAPEAPKKVELTPSFEEPLPFVPLVDSDTYLDYGDFCELQREHYAYSRVGYDWTERISYYNKEIYSIKDDKVTISNENGDLIQSFPIAETPKANKIFVNARGVFVFNHYIYDKVGVIAHYSLNGNLLNTLPLKGELMNSGYAYGDFIWMIQEEEETFVTSLLSYDFHAMTYKIYPMPWKKGLHIDAVYGTREKAILHLSFEGKNHNDGGWYLFDLKANTISCLSDSELLPEWVVSAPKRYEDAEEKLSYQRTSKQDIRFFDLLQDVMWVAHNDGDKDYLKAYNIAPPGKAIACEDEAPWYLSRFTNPHYFDGKVMYHAPDYYHFGSFSQDGTYTELKTPATGHGRCQHFLVLGDYVYIDTDAQYEIFQYPNNPNYMGEGKMMPVLPH